MNTRHQATHGVVQHAVIAYSPPRRSVAQSGSAPHWGCGGRGFESRRSDHLTVSLNSHVVVLPRVGAFRVVTANELRGLRPGMLDRLHANAFEISIKIRFGADELMNQFSDPGAPVRYFIRRSRFIDRLR